MSTDTVPDIYEKPGVPYSTTTDDYSTTQIGAALPTVETASVVNYPMGGGAPSSDPLNITFSGTIATPPSMTVGTPITPITISTNFSGGPPPKVYSIHSGTLPPGLSLHATTGVVSGTPTTPQAAANVVFKGTDNNGNSANSNGVPFTVVAALAPELVGATIVASTTKRVASAQYAFRAQSSSNLHDTPFVASAVGSLVDTADLAAWRTSVSGTTINCPIFYNQMDAANNLVPITANQPRLTDAAGVFDGGVKAFRTTGGTLRSTLNSAVLSAFTVYLKTLTFENGAGSVFILMQQATATSAVDRFTVNQNQETNDEWCAMLYRAAGQKYGKKVPIAGTPPLSLSYCFTFDLAATPQIRAWKAGVEQTGVVGVNPALLANLAAAFWAFGNDRAGGAGGSCTNTVFKDIVVFENIVKSDAEIAALFALLG